MDVLTADAASLRVAQEQDCAVELLQHVGAKRYKQADRLHSELRKEGKDLSRRIKKFSARLEKRIPDSSDDAKKNQLPGPTDVAAAALRLSRELTMPRSLNRNNLHPYRLKVKQLRDVLRLAENTSNPQFTGVLGEVKDAIGDWHDWEELVSIAARVLTHGANCKLLAKLKEVSGEKYDHAFSLTIKMRKRFLRAQNHKLPGPVLVATAGIAS
jgi:CHAD domain-containing protein